MSGSGSIGSDIGSGIAKRFKDLYFILVFMKTDLVQFRCFTKAKDEVDKEQVPPSRPSCYEKQA